MDDRTLTEKVSMRDLVAQSDPAILQLLPAYVTNRITDIDVLRRALEEGDFVHLRRLGHNLKGSGAAYGLPPISMIGARIEAAAKSGDEKELHALSKSFEDMVMELDTIIVKSGK